MEAAAQHLVNLRTVYTVCLHISSGSILRMCPELLHKWDTAYFAHPCVSYTTEGGAQSVSDAVCDESKSVSNAVKLFFKSVGQTLMRRSFTGLNECSQNVVALQL